MKPNIVIKIEGRPGQGKTTISRLIETTLTSQGIVCEVKGMRDTHCDHMGHLAGKSVLIEEIQARREQ